MICKSNQITCTFVSKADHTLARDRKLKLNDTARRRFPTLRASCKEIKTAKKKRKSANHAWQRPRDDSKHIHMRFFKA